MTSNFSGSLNDNSTNSNQSENTNSTSNENNTLQQKINDLEDEVYFLEDENDSLRRKLERMKQKMKTMKTQSFIFSNIDVSNTHNKVKANKLMEEVHFIADLKSQIEKLSSVDEKPKRDKKNILKRRSNTRNDLDQDDKYEENATNPEEKNEVTNNITDINEKDEKIKDDDKNIQPNANYNQISNEISVKKDIMKDWINNYYQKINKFSNELDEKLKSLTISSDEKFKQGKFDNINQKLSQALNNFQSLSKDLNLSKTENQSLKAEIESIKEENQKMKLELDSVKEENNQLKSEVENSKTENQRLRLFNQKLKSNNNNLESEVHSIKEENQTLKAESQQINEENQKLRTENQETKSENFLLKSDNQKLISENQALKAENQTLTAENQMTKDQLKLQAENEKKPKQQRDKLVESQKNMIAQLQSQLQLSEKNVKAKTKQEKDAISKLNSKFKSFDNLIDKTFGKFGGQRLIKTNSRQIMNKMGDLDTKIQKLQDKVQQLQKSQRQIQMAIKQRELLEVPKTPQMIDKSWKEILDYIKPISPSQSQISAELFNSYLDRIDQSLSYQDFTDPIVSSASSTTKAVEKITNAINTLVSLNPLHTQTADQKINDIITKLLSAPIEGNLRTPIVWKNTVNIITSSEPNVGYKQWKPCVEEAFFVDSLQTLTEKNIGHTMAEQLLIVINNESIATNPSKFNYWINIISDFILPLFWQNYECIDYDTQNSIILPMIQFFNRNMAVPSSISTLSGIHKNPQVAYYTIQILIRADSLLPSANEVKFTQLHKELLQFLQVTFPVKITVNHNASLIYPDAPKDAPFKESVQYFLLKQCKRPSNPSFSMPIKSSNFSSNSVSVNISDSEQGTGSLSLSNSLIANLIADNGNSNVQLLLTFFNSELMKQTSTIIMQLSKSTSIFHEAFLIFSTLFYKLTEALMVTLVKKAKNEMNATHSKIKSSLSQPDNSVLNENDLYDSNEMARSGSNSSLSSVTSVTSNQGLSPRTPQNTVYLTLSLTNDVIQAYSDLFMHLLHLRPFLSACQRYIPSEKLGPTLINPVLTCQNQLSTYQLVSIFFTIYFDSAHYSPNTLRAFCEKLISMSELFSISNEMKDMFNLYASIFASICSNQLLEMNKVAKSNIPISPSLVLPSDEQFLSNPVFYTLSSTKIKCQRVPYLFFAFPLHFTNDAPSDVPSPAQETQRLRNRRISTPLAKANPDQIAAAQVASTFISSPTERSRTSSLKMPVTQATTFPSLSPSKTAGEGIPKLTPFSPPPNGRRTSISENKSSDIETTPHFTVSPDAKVQMAIRRRRLSSTGGANNLNVAMNNNTAHNFALSYMKGIGKYNDYIHTVRFVDTLFSIYLGAKKKNSRCYSAYIYKTICPFLFDIFLHKADDENEKEPNSYSQPLLTLLSRLIEDLVFRQNIDSKLSISWLKFYIEAITATSKRVPKKGSENEFDIDIENNNKELTLLALSSLINICCSPFTFRYSIIPIINSRLVNDYTSMFSSIVTRSNFKNPNSYISNVLRYTSSTIGISKQIQQMNSSSTLTNSSSFLNSYQLFNNFITDSQFKLSPFFFTTFYFVFQCEIANDEVKSLSPELLNNFKKLVSNISSISKSDCLLNLISVIPYHYNEINAKSPELIPFIFNHLSEFAKTDKCSNQQFTSIMQFATDLICSIRPEEALFENIITFMLCTFNDNQFKNKLRDEYFSFFFENFMNSRQLKGKSAEFYNKANTGDGPYCTIVDNKSEIITFNLFSSNLTISNCYETNNYKVEIRQQTIDNSIKLNNDESSPKSKKLQSQSIEYLISPNTKMNPALMSDVFLVLNKNKQWLFSTQQPIELVESFSERSYSEKHVIPIVYIGQRQRTLDEILSNKMEQTSEEFIGFLSSIGENVNVSDTSFMSSISRVISLIDDPSQTQQQQQLLQQLTSGTSKPQLQESAATSSQIPALSIKATSNDQPPSPRLSSPRQRLSPRILSSRKDQEKPEKQEKQASNSQISLRLHQIMNLLSEVDNSIFFKNCRHEVLFVPYPSLHSNDRVSSFVPATISIAWFESPFDNLPKKALGSMFIIALRPLVGDMFLVNVRCNIPQKNKNTPNDMDMNKRMKITSIPFCCKNPFMVPSFALGAVVRDLVIIIENHINNVSRSISHTTQSQALAQLKNNQQANYLVTSDITPSNCFFYSSKLAFKNSWSVIRKAGTMF